jgi:hypothetical protein
MAVARNVVNSIVTFTFHSCRQHNPPAGHSVHVPFVAWPVLSEYVPAGHFWQSVLPFTLDQVPVPHTVHVPAEAAPMACEYVPSEHVEHVLGELWLTAAE